MKRLITISTLMSFAVLLIVTGTANADGQCYTGCITKGGTIVHMAPGLAPLKPCSKNEKAIQVCGSKHRDVQNEEGKVEFTTFCKAFEKNGLDLPDGCPDDGTGKFAPTNFSAYPVKRVGVHPGQLDIFAGTNGEPFNLCDLMIAAAPNPPAGELQLPGAYFFKRFEIVIQQRTGDPWDELEEACRLKCENDDFCVAADLFYEGGQSGQGSQQYINRYSCSIYHHSDALTSQFSESCGTSALDPTEFGVKQLCAEKASGVGTPVNIWFVRQPDDCTPN